MLELDCASSARDKSIMNLSNRMAKRQ